MNRARDRFKNILPIISPAKRFNFCQSESGLIAAVNLQASRLGSNPGKGGINFMIAALPRNCQVIPDHR